ncbi:uncharacterized protein, partial [Eurosta solidaginis]|uniref:uncharacterized protein n=1 Tax=Eurosta solidaginis TaxID=178769 RepID=UPI003530B10B
MESEGINVDDDVFHPDGDETTTKIEEKTETSQTVTSTDLNMILVAISAETSTVSSQLAEQKTYMASQMESQETRISEMSTQITSKIEAQETRISEMSSQMSSQLEEQKTYMSERQDKMEAEMDALKDRIQELQLNRPITSASTLKLKSPTFDGSVPFQVFKLQFEKTAAVNNWNAEDKVAALFMALKGPAAEILQTIPEGERNCYEALMGVLERQYGTEYRRQMYQVELLNRFQWPGETLQEFASDIERLAHLANADAAVEYTERVKIQSFINGT